MTDTTMLVLASACIKRLISKKTVCFDLPASSLKLRVTFLFILSYLAQSNCLLLAYLIVTIQIFQWSLGRGTRSSNKWVSLAIFTLVLVSFATKTFILIIPVTLRGLLHRDIRSLTLFICTFSLGDMMALN